MDERHLKNDSIKKHDHAHKQFDVQNISTQEHYLSPHDILGKEYEFNGVSFTVLGMDKEFYDHDDERNNSLLDTVTVITIGSQCIPVIPFQGGLAYITKIQIGGEVITGYSDILKQLKFVERAPVGWMTKYRLSRELKVGKAKVGLFAYQYRQSHPEWFCDYKEDFGKLFEHYSPTLCALIRDSIPRIERPPDGWLSRKSFAHELGVGLPSIEAKIESYRQVHPDWFKVYRRRSRQFEYLSPQLCGAIRNELALIERPPEGWVHRNTIAHEIGISHLLASLETEKYRAAHPEWFRNYKNEQGRMYEYYSPELVHILWEKYTLESNPAGWMTCGTLADELYSIGNTVSLMSEKYKVLHPEWFRVFRAETGHIRNFLAPELCDRIRAEFHATEMAPIGWKTTGGIKSELGVTVSKAKKFMERYRDEHPEWFKKFRLKGGQIYEHYSPELTHLFRSEMEKDSDAPPGWVTNNSLAIELGVDFDVVKSCADQYKGDYPKWFQRYRGKNKNIFIHYSPELCDRVRKGLIDK